MDIWKKKTDFKIYFKIEQIVQVIIKLYKVWRLKVKIWKI